MKLPVIARGEGDALLLIHGGVSEASFFSGLAEQLQDQYRVVTYDRRGYGNSEEPGDGDYSVRTQAEDAARILEAYTDGKTWILGNSAGCVIALELALTRPELVRGLILMEPSVAFDEESCRELAAWNRKLNEYKESGRLNKVLPAFYREFGPDEPAASNGEGVSFSEIQRVYKNLANFMKGEVNPVERYRPSPEALRGLDVPVSVLVSEIGESRMFGRTSVAGAKALDWPVYRVPGNHNALRDHPAEAAAVIDERIRKMKTEGSAPKND